MKVAFYNGVFARIGGIEAFTNDLAVSLLEAGVSVTIICAASKNATLDHLEQRGAAVKRVPVTFGCRWNWPDKLLQRFAPKWMEGMDLVIHQKPNDDPFYQTLPTDVSHVFLTAYDPAEQFGEPGRILRFFSHFKAVITQTQGFRQALLDEGITHPVHVLPLIPPEPADPLVGKRDHETLRLGLMGRLEAQKNPVYALEIMEALSAGLSGKKQVEFHFYGTGSMEPELQRRAASGKVRVIFHGAYRRDDLPRIVSENDGFLIPSLYEGQCIVALEVLACGRPVFATAVGALPEILSAPARGALLPAGDPAVAAQTVADWFETNGYDRADTILQSYQKDYAQEKVRSDYVTLIRKLAGEA